MGALCLQTVADAPHLLDSEVVDALRRLVVAQQIGTAAADTILLGFRRIVIHRWSAARLLSRVWELRHDVSEYDATCVALAELLQEPLLTTDRRLAAAHGRRCQVEVVQRSRTPVVTTRSSGRGS